MYFLNNQDMNGLLSQWQQSFTLYAPKRFPLGGRYSDTDCIRYGEIQTMEEIVWEEKSHYSFKEVLTPSCQTLFYFTDNSVTEAQPPSKGRIIFLRSCDLHALQRLDEIYLRNGSPDFYYERLRNQTKFILMDCVETFENCFCVSMGTNDCENFDVRIQPVAEGFLVENRSPLWEESFCGKSKPTPLTAQKQVSANKIQVSIPENLSAAVGASTLWKEYDGRCIDCGRCNFVCPTCTCFTMQDVFYTENGKAGERRRVLASCMVDGYTDVAGGGSYRKNNGERMRFKVLHKVLDFQQRNGYHMCVGCGRCDDICPEYISFSATIHKLHKGLEEVQS